MSPIVPALIPSSVDEVEATLAAWSFVHEIHIDVVDGVFVPFRSWPYHPLGDPMEVKTWTDPFTLEVDLMVSDPTAAAWAWAKAGADMLVFHAEGISAPEFIKISRSLPTSVGIAAGNDLALTELEPYLAGADYVQLMGIATIGAQGQPFDVRVLERITKLKESHPELSITVDGSVNAETILSLRQAGAHRFICGSSVVKASDPALAHQSLLALLN